MSRERSHECPWCGDPVGQCQCDRARSALPTETTAGHDALVAERGVRARDGTRGAAARRDRQRRIAVLGGDAMFGRVVMGLTIGALVAALYVTTAVYRAVYRREG